MIAFALTIGGAFVAAYVISYALIELADQLGLCYSASREAARGGPPPVFTAPHKDLRRPKA